MALTLTRSDDTPLIGPAKAITGATNATPIVMTVTAHGYSNGDFVSQTGVGGNTAANGTFQVANKTANTYELTDPSTGANVAGNGAYTSGGTATRIVYYRLERGVPSSKQTVKIKNTGAATVPEPATVLYAEETPGSGVFSSEGHPVVDEQMGRFQITAIDSSGTPGQTAGLLSVVQVLGHLSTAKLPPILPGNWVIADVWLEQGAASASGGAVNIKFEITNDTTSIPIGGGVSQVASGILSGIGQPESFLISGLAVTASSPADHDAHVAAGAWLLDGVEYSDGTSRTVTLNNLDGDSVALTGGNNYIANLFVGPDAVIDVVKAPQSGAYLSPAGNLVGHLLVGQVQVTDLGGGAWSVGAIAISLAYGRMLVTYSGTGLNVVVGTGKGIATGFLLLHSVKETIAMTASSTNYLWWSPNGQVVKTLTSTPVSPGSLTLATVTTNASAVTSLVDTRVFVGTSGPTAPTHATTHATAGSDPISPASIGAAATVHTHAQADVTGLVAALAAKAPSASPALTGTPTAPNAALATDTTQIATTAFVKDAIAGGVHRTVVTKATGDSPYAVADSDYTILANTSGGNVTITLPAAPAQGRWLEIKNVNGGVNTLTIDRNGKLIDGAAANLTTTVNNYARSLQYDATFGWFIL